MHVYIDKLLKKHDLWFNKSRKNREFFCGVRGLHRILDQAGDCVTREREEKRLGTYNWLTQPLALALFDP
jgi:hypothetical protein